MSNLKRIQSIHAGHRRARAMLVVVVAAWSIMLIVAHRRGPNGYVLLLLAVITLINLGLYLRGAVRSYTLHVQMTAGSHCMGCDYDLWGSLRGGAQACPECGTPIPPGTHARLLPPGLVPPNPPD